MKNFSLLSMLVVLLLTACVESGDPQFSEMPAGPLQRYTFVSIQAMSENDTMLVVRLWREDTLSTGGLLYYYESEVRALAEFPMPIVVDEEVFTKAYELLKEKKLYAMATWYKTQWKGDAYGYAPWTLTAELPGAVFSTESDGSTPAGYEGSDPHVVNNYLRGVFEKKGYEWLATQPATLDDYTSFSNLRQRFVLAEAEDNADAASSDGVLTFEMRTMDGDSLLDTYTLKMTGTNLYRDTRTGRTVELRRVEDEVMAVCYDRGEQPLWAMCGHQRWYEERCLEHKMEYVSDGRYKDNDGKSVIIENHKIQGFPESGQQRCVIYNFHGYPAERLHVGDYPDEKDYAFRRSETGLNIYATKYATDAEDDWDTVPTELLQCLHDTGDHNYKWLHNDLLDSDLLRYFDAAQRKAMLYIVENPEEEATPFDTWNIWLLRTFDSVVPFEAEPDYK